jgi:hypothetical protein
MARTAVIAGTATATVGATKAVMGGGKKQDAQQQAAAQQQADLAAQQAYAAGQQDALAQQATSQEAAGETGDSLDEQLVKIQKLSVMKDQGLITEEEFAAKKAQILGI